MICKNCGYENDNDAKFCEMCGTETRDIPLENRHGKFKLKKLLSVVLVIILGIIIVTGYRIIVFKIASDSIHDIENTPACMDDIYIGSDSIYVNITDNYIKQNLYSITNAEAYLRVYNDGEDSCYSTLSESYDKYSICFPTQDPVTINDYSNFNAYEVTDIYQLLEENHTYKVELELRVNMPYDEGRMNKIDAIFGLNLCDVITIENNYTYKDGELIKIDK